MCYIIQICHGTSQYTVRNVRKFTKLLCYKGNVKFDDINDVFE